LSGSPEGDSSLLYLLDLNGEIYPMDSGHWVKFEAWRVESTEQIPHGIRYSLTLHNRHNTRLLGYDNAHGVKFKRGMFVHRRATWDHKHQKEKVFPYEFRSAGQLLEDFWRDVDAILNS
jgi:hypothetical protein